MKNSILDRFFFSDRPGWEIARLIAVVLPAGVGLWLAFALYVEAWNASTP
jgi:hypothetical protein